MTSRTQRRQWRSRLRHWCWRINYLLAVVLVLALLAGPGVASGQSWDRCWKIPHGQVCVARAQKVTRIVCDWGYQPRFGRVHRCVPLGGQP